MFNRRHCATDSQKVGANHNNTYSRACNRICATPLSIGYYKKLYPLAILKTYIIHVHFSFSSSRYKTCPCCPRVVPSVFLFAFYLNTNYEPMYILYHHLCTRMHFLSATQQKLQEHSLSIAFGYFIPQFLKILFLVDAGFRSGCAFRTTRVAWNMFDLVDAPK